MRRALTNQKEIPLAEYPVGNNIITKVVPVIHSTKKGRVISMTSSLNFFRAKKITREEHKKEEVVIMKPKTFGDLYVQLQVQIPDTLNDKQKELFEQIKSTI